MQFSASSKDKELRSDDFKAFIGIDLLFEHMVFLSTNVVSWIWKNLYFLL